MEIIYFTLVAIGLYFMADWVLDRIETARGERLKNRSVIFFAIILALALASFQLLSYIMRA